MSAGLVQTYRAFAHNNAWANHRLLTSCASLGQEEFEAERTSFFPSLQLTLNHIYVIDLFYVDALEGGWLGPAAWKNDVPCPTVAELTVAQAAARGRAGAGNAQGAARGNAGAANAGAAAQTTPCGEQMANPPGDALQGAITHDFQTEGYYIVSGGGTAFIDGKVVNGRRSTNNPDGGPNGPGCGGGVAVGSRKVELKVGDVLIVPPGVIHGWFDIPDHVDYLSFRPSHGVMKNGWVNPTIAPK